MNQQKIEGEWLEITAPAKVNLMLSVHGKRGDGFHELTSLMVACHFGDTLKVRANGADHDLLHVDGIEVPVDPSNLILQAADVFRNSTGYNGHFDFHLLKRIPLGAGLGGGSSDAVAALQALNSIAKTKLSKPELTEMAAVLGSDCPFFVDSVPALIRGRGEVVEPLDAECAKRLTGKKLLLFKPHFGVETVWAYRQLAAYPEFNYESLEVAMARMRRFSSVFDAGDLLHNVFENPVGRKFTAIPVLLEKLREKGVNCQMSGSGSCCFALIDNGISVSEIVKTVVNCWGEGIFWVETSVY
ncbi:MAG: 4-(cytidine 5'-diphospho)-2-C-methyl-D-erythritol kinase [Verrucomicrobiota bacterium]